MYIEQLYTSCLSEAAYYIESNGEAAIIDPLRDVEMYIEMAASRNARIKYIFETHFHADFVSGHLDLSKSTGAPIVFGPGTETSYPVHVATDGEIFQLGEISLQVLHTPGHTLESSCFLLKDSNGKDHAVFTGDTLFVGDVGRPDLSSGNMTSEDLAAMMYDALQNKILPLANDVIVYPAHGPGSSCGKNLGPATFSTIGSERQHNYALQSPSKAAFIKAVTDGLTAPPLYFPVNAKINQQGYQSIDEVLAQSLKPLDIEQFKALIENDDVLILDTREAQVFAQGFIPGSVSIGLEGRFAEWAGMLLPFNKPIVLVTASGKEKESAIRLARVGFDNMIGCLTGGFEAWKETGAPIDLIIDVEADELAMDIPFDDQLVVLDVRRPAEFANGHVKHAVNLSLETLNDPLNMANIDELQNLYIHCAGGYRSVIAASLLKRQGIHNLRNVLGGWNKIKEVEGIDIEKDATVLN